MSKSEPRGAKLLMTSTSRSRNYMDCMLSILPDGYMNLHGSEIEISQSSCSSKFCSLLFSTDF